MLQATALNLVIVGLMVVIWTFIWKTAASSLVKRNPESGLGKAMGTILA